jgi:hypothetical protein
VVLDCHGKAARQSRARQDKAARKAQRTISEAPFAKAKRDWDAWHARIAAARQKGKGKGELGPMAHVYRCRTPGSAP